MTMVGSLRFAGRSGDVEWDGGFMVTPVQARTLDGLVHLLKGVYVADGRVYTQNHQNGDVTAKIGHNAVTVKRSGRLYPVRG